MTIEQVKSKAIKIMGLPNATVSLSAKGKILSNDNVRLCKFFFFLTSGCLHIALDTVVFFFLPLFAFSRKHWRKLRLLVRQFLCHYINNTKDCITEDDDSNEKRAKMPCGHAIGAATMYNYLQFVLDKNLYTHQITCPVLKCQREWDLELVSKVADLSDDEYLYYQGIINQRFSQNEGHKTCPTCGSKGERGENLTIFSLEELWTPNLWKFKMLSVRYTETAEQLWNRHSIPLQDKNAKN
ncbi:hypothetical protein RFI_24115 [Reticulomyxa filosa]|uniref:Uncharacterized protein n=1 Tax=Reticulomyxa filosa TaxID=46433 RepID=X6MH86_RETFI|nr:hypothetical protein RFI_24115 [Reticulomyxa filosa]|eukprot:ETO13259.1 hypothetical protein RFI_24115 [Reticulomyxa filosa]